MLVEIANVIEAAITLEKASHLMLNSAVYSATDCKERYANVVPTSKQTVTPT